MTDNGVTLNVQDVKHTLRAGIALLGSMKNDRYTTIVVQDKSVCPKHASIRYDPSCATLEVMDLCSVRGVTVDRRPIEALTWYKITTLSQILLGTVPVSVEATPAGTAGECKKEDLSFLLDDNSQDFIDCSLEETNPGRKAVKSSSGLLSGSHRSVASGAESITPPGAAAAATVAVATSDGCDLAKKKTAPLGDSFLIPATQQLEDSVISSAAVNESLPCLKQWTSTDGKTVPDQKAVETVAQTEEFEGDDDDDFFIIPETQQSMDDEPMDRGLSPVIDRIDPTVDHNGNAERAEQTQGDDEYFQMTVDDDGNSDDGLFNNIYVEASQNLLQNMDESYRKIGAAASAARNSIQPNRSVDSISFQEHRNTTQDMSRLEWNETRQEQEQSPCHGTTSTKDAGGVKTLLPNAQTDDDRSITPELHFDEQPTTNEKLDRDDRVTPDVDFDKLPVDGAIGDGAVGGAAAAAAVAAVLEPIGEDAVIGEEDKHEISLNQEGCPDNRYDVETQVLDAECEDAVAKNQGDAAAQVDSKMKDIYDMETQAFELDPDDGVGLDDPYDLLTQPMAEPPPKRAPLMGPPKTPAKRTVARLSEQSSPAVSADDFLTQPMIPPESLRSLFRTSGGVQLDPADIATQPMSPPPLAGFGRRNARSPSIDPADLLTQPMSPPKYLVAQAEDWKREPAEKSFDAYDQPTQPLNSPKELLKRKSQGVAKANVTTLSAKKPFVKVVDIRRVPFALDCSDPYAMPTQPLEDGERNNPYELATQPLEGRPSSERKAVASTSLEVSHFDPQINSTVRQSMVLQVAGDQQKSNEKKIEISPSSNKENRTGRNSSITSSDSESSATEDDGSDLDDDVCLSATLPVDQCRELDKNKDRSAADKLSRRGTRRNATSPSLFKLPVASEMRTVETLNTPNRGTNQRAPSHRAVVELTEFLTPEHPLLSLPKPDRILRAAGDMCELAAASRRTKGCSKYPFNDSSDSGSDEEARLRFKKSNVSVALERELEQLKGVAKQKKNETEKRQEKAPVGKRSAGMVEPDAPDDTDSMRTVSEPKKMKRATVEKSSSSSSSHRKPEDGDVAENIRKSSARGKAKSEDKQRKEEKRSYRTKEKEVRREEKEKVSKSSSEKRELGRVTTRSGREVRARPRIDESVDYRRKSGPESDPPSSSAVAAVPRASGRIRQAKESHSEERKEKRDEPFKREPVPTRESKRQKDPRYRRRSISPVEPAASSKRKPPETERSRRTTTTTTTAAKKVDLSADKECNGGLVDVSAASSTGSDGSASRPARSSRPRLIFTRMSPEPYRQCIARAGGKVVDIPELANVLVTDRIFRTYKFLCAVAKGIPIVGQSYLDALEAASEHTPVDPWDHILRDEPTEKRYKFHLRDTLLKARTHKLFQGYHVFVTSNTQPPASELYLILSCAGATALKHPTQSVQPSAHMFVISDPADAASWPKYSERYPSIEIVSTEGFMLSIMQHSIAFKKFRLQ